MKIIAQGTHFICEVGEQELAKICGFEHSRSSGCPTFVVGSTININAMYKRLADLKYNSRRISSVKKELTDMLATLEKQEYVMQEASFTDKPGE